MRSEALSRGESQHVGIRCSRSGWDYGAGQASSDDQYRPLEPLIPAAKPGGQMSPDRQISGNTGHGCRSRITERNSLPRFTH